jgi:ATP-binding cassette subfamily B protein
VLDEATSSIDTQTEELIQNGIDYLLKGRTSFIIAHRLSTIKKADLILVVKDGKIIEQGTHKSLISEKGYYYKLYTRQFEDEKALEALHYLN